MEVDGRHKWQGTEADLQRKCEKYLGYFPDLVVIRFPDAAYRAIFASTAISEYAKRLIAKYVKGIPDLILLKNRDSGVDALCLELKTSTGKLSQGQKNFGERIKVYVVRDFESFTKMVEKFRKGEK